MDHLLFTPCSGISKKSSLRKNRLKNTKHVKTPVLFSSSEDECADTSQNSRSNSVTSKSFSTPSRHNVTKKRGLFTSKIANHIFNDGDIEKVGNTGEVLHKANGQTTIESVLTDSDSDDVKFKRNPKLLKITDSSEDECFMKENIATNRTCENEPSSMDNVVGSCKTRSVNNVISDLTNCVATSLNVTDVFQSPLEKPKKFLPVIFDSDELSSDELETNHKLHGSKPSSAKQSFLKSLSPSVPDVAADEEALLYRTRFKDRKLELTQKLFALFNDKIFGNRLPADMPVEWNDHLLKTAGYARCRRSGGIKTCSIALSTKVVDSAYRLRDTLMHEMCHAVVWLMHGVNGHGSLWQTWAVRCCIAFPEVHMPKRCHNFEINFKYIYKCVNCTYSVGRHSKSLNRQHQLCPRCNGKFYLAK